jgi:hypothetical protein
MSQEPDPKLCLVVMPSGHEFEQTFTQVVNPVAEDVGLRCLRPEETSPTKLGWDHARDLIDQARLVITDLSGYDVDTLQWATLASARGVGKLIVVSQSIEPLMFLDAHLQGVHQIVYSMGQEDCITFAEELKRMIQAVLRGAP